MSKFKKVLIALVILVGLGAIAKQYNEQNHMEMAIEQCGDKDSIARVDSKGFECKKT
ncbi:MULTISPECIES: hypothetical protein [Pseudoalteromonas]|jgi:hypothetical protein|uniref:Uncharacterized protein n=1 Tax=Pseudoalteromonas lipolytica TaxID=570156 RepID=A0ABY1GHP4_9GAMM|nr:MULTISPECIES: hypothetical protein [Pseudoalteromonas]MBE0353241.1 hypothetical protein [Pseudoalteromonas lipolytica LMEB 39]MCC9660465.1 hypothetical protein [Pseudoalteromonas sp. MB41]QLJ10461.1 hypothetical protein GZH31_17270 [Pseudoalteromonas sp. JSTW]SFT73298.1 hypothetical protein SAMN04487854_108114 [Pseudoalteromonas lipolytica]